MTIVILLIALVALGFAIAGLRGAVWVPARTADTLELLKVLKLPQDPHVFEFGAGDGRNLVLIRHRYPGAHFAGIEINPVMWFFAMLRAGRFAHIKLGDGWHANLSKYNVVVVFLMPKFMPQFEEKVLAELTPGSLVISYAFELPSMTPILKQNNYFVYKIEASK